MKRFDERLDELWRIANGEGRVKSTVEVEATFALIAIGEYLDDIAEKIEKQQETLDTLVQRLYEHFGTYFDN